MARALLEPPPFAEPPYRTLAWLGARTLSPLHHDPYDGVLCQLIGTKQALVFSPGDEGLYPFPPHSLQRNTSQVDLERPDPQRWPRYAARLRDDARVAALEQGDALYIPRGWWHAVACTSAASFSVSFWWPPPPVGRSSAR